MKCASLVVEVLILFCVPLLSATVKAHKIILRFSTFYSSYNANFIIGIGISKKVFDRREFVIANLKQGVSDYLITIVGNKWRDIERFANLKLGNQMTHNRANSQITFLSDLLDTETLLIQIQRQNMGRCSMNTGGAFSV